jgi:hypothetical protein
MQRANQISGCEANFKPLFAGMIAGTLVGTEYEHQPGNALTGFDYRTPYL